MEKILVTVLLPLFLFSCTTQKKVVEARSDQASEDPIFGEDGTLFLGRVTELIQCDGGITYSLAGAPVNLVKKLTNATPEGESVMLGSKSYTIVPLKKGAYALMPQDSILTYSLLVTVQTDSPLNASQVENYFVLQKLCKRKI